MIANPSLQRAALLLSLLLGVCACGREDAASPAEPQSVDKTTTEVVTATEEGATYVGATVCAGCHEQAYDAWRGSDHDLALQRAEAASVLADFAAHAPEGDLPGVEFSHRDGAYFVKPDADTPPLEVIYTFGVRPLQQYVVDAGDGRLQVLPFPWDTRDAEAGGQRWYALYPGDYPPGDPMHWRGRANNWNGMCADCHSTAVEKVYDPATHGYHTSYQEEDVGCEACHGPGSLHVSAARGGAAEPGMLADVSGQAREINACAPCHSRRSQLAEGFDPSRSWLDFYLPTLPATGLYTVDGQILDEVYVYGSFLQSRMHLKGVTCSNCHDPHSTRLKLDGNAVCTQCHNPEGRAEFPSLKPASYDDPAHHFHPVGSEGAACVNCHMPARTYMGVDVRRDHSFRIPRPDLTQTLGVPNTCTACHEDRDAAWASAEIEKHYGPRPPHYGTLFAAARNGTQDAEPGLAALVTNTDQPIMVRATAASLLGAYSRGYTIDALRFAAKASPLLELGAADGATGLSPDSQWRLLAPLLDDDHRAVRMAAFDALMPLAADPAYRARLQPHLVDYVESLQASLDFPETQVNLATAWATFGDVARAESALDEALALQRSYVPALLNLADLYRATGRDPDGEALLLEALGVAPDSPEAAFGYALWLTRQDRPAEALGYFQRAAAAAPDMLNYGYAYALSLNESGQGEAAVAELKRLIDRWPNHQDLLYTLVTILRDQGRREEALEYLDRLIELNPTDENLRTFRERLSRATG